MIPAKVDIIEIARSRYPGLLLGAALILPFNVSAEWLANVHTSADSDTETHIAFTGNDAGYTLEIYHDSVNAIRSRFTLPKGLLTLTGKSCPTYQIDRGIAQNRSINGALCLADSQWAEFILGYIEDNTVSSSTLLALMNGITITYRYKLSNNDYRETSFSLQGSKRALLSALGQNITVTASH